MCCVYLFIIVVFVWRPSVAQNRGLWRRLRRWFVSAYFARKICYEAVLSHLRHYPRIYLEKLSKTTRCLSQVRRISFETQTGFLSNSSNKGFCCEHFGCLLSSSFHQSDIRICHFCTISAILSQQLTASYNGQFLSVSVWNVWSSLKNPEFALKDWREPQDRLFVLETSDKDVTNTGQVITGLVLQIEVVWRTGSRTLAKINDNTTKTNCTTCLSAQPYLYSITSSMWCGSSK